MDGPPAQSLGVEPVDPEIMKKPPRSRNSNIITKPLITRVLTTAFIVTVGTMFVYISEMADGVVTNKDATMVNLKRRYTMNLHSFNPITVTLDFYYFCIL